MAKSRTAKSNLFRVFEQSPQPIYVLDGERNIVFCNQALSDWVGEPIEVVTTWRCDFHSEPRPDGSASKAAQLCPPLEGLDGESITFPFQVSQGCGTASIEIRNAVCHSIHHHDEKPSTLITVNTLPNSRSNPQQAESSRFQPLLHDLLKHLRDEVRSDSGFEPINGVSPVSLRLRRQIQCFMNSPQPSLGDILIVGPAGSGRQRIAETIHYHKFDAKSAGPLVPVDSTLCDPEMVQSTIREMFSLGGEGLPAKMLLLDADKLSSPAQIELREFFEMPDFELSIIATATQSLAELVESDQYDERLAIRLSTHVIEIPSLADRPTDIPLLIQALVEKSNSKSTRQLSGANKSALQLLTDYHWPGEYRELEETIELACQNATGPNIVKDDLPKRLMQAETARAYSKTELETLDLAEYLRAIECELIWRAVAQSDGNKSRAAKLLGLSRASLLRRWEQMEDTDV